MEWCKFWDCELESWDDCESCIFLKQEIVSDRADKNEMMIRYCSRYIMGDIRPVESYDSQLESWDE